MGPSLPIDLDHCFNDIAVDGATSSHQEGALARGRQAKPPKDNGGNPGAHRTCIDQGLNPLIGAFRAGGDGNGVAEDAHPYPLGRPRPRMATMLRWISEVPPSMVLATERRYM